MGSNSKDQIRNSNQCSKDQCSNFVIRVSFELRVSDFEFSHAASRRRLGGRGFLQGFGRNQLHELLADGVELDHQAVDPADEVQVKGQRWNRHGQTESRCQQGFANAAGQLFRPSMASLWAISLKAVIMP